MSKTRLLIVILAWAGCAEDAPPAAETKSALDALGVSKLEVEDVGEGRRIVLRDAAGEVAGMIEDDADRVVTRVKWRDGSLHVIRRLEDGVRVEAWPDTEADAPGELDPEAVDVVAAVRVALGEDDDLPRFTRPERATEAYGYRNIWLPARVCGSRYEYASVGVQNTCNFGFWADYGWDVTGFVASTWISAGRYPYDGTTGGRFRWSGWFRPWQNVAFGKIGTSYLGCLASWVEANYCY